MRDKNIKSFIDNHINTKNVDESEVLEPPKECSACPCAEPFRDFGLSLIKDFLRDRSLCEMARHVPPLGWLVQYSSTNHIAFLDHSHIMDILSEGGNADELSLESVFSILECSALKPIFGELQKLN